jgi:arabinogalactan oligomer/maltooligosaccharide transport system substrate-binding protein
VKISRRTLLSASALGIAVAALTACGNDGPPEDDSAGSNGGGAGAGDAPTRADADLVIWADQLKADSLDAAAKKWGEANGLTVAVQPISGDMQGGFITANQAGNGPDILVGAHDWIGNLVQNAAVSPVQLPADASTALSAIALTAVTYDGQTYGVPYALETLALFSNPALTDNPAPASIEDLVAAGEAGGAENALILQVGETGDSYHMQPLYSSAGGYLFGTGAEGDLDPSDMGVGKEGSIMAAEKIGELGKRGVLKTSITGGNAISLFAEGNGAYLISGPWAVAEIETAGIDFGMSAVPGFEGMGPAQPFAGVNAFFVASSARNQAFAQQFVNEIAASPEIPAAMFELNKLPPVNLELQETLSGDNPELIKIAEYAETAIPLPAIPEMAAVFGPLGQAEAAIVGGADPESTMVSAGEEIASRIG